MLAHHPQEMFFGTDLFSELIEIVEKNIQLIPVTPTALIKALAFMCTDLSPQRTARQSVLSIPPMGQGWSRPTAPSTSITAAPHLL